MKEFRCTVDETHIPTSSRHIHDSPKPQLFKCVSPSACSLSLPLSLSLISFTPFSPSTCPGRQLQNMAPRLSPAQKMIIPEMFSISSICIGRRKSPAHAEWSVSTPLRTSAPTSSQPCGPSFSGVTTVPSVWLSLGPTSFQTPAREPTST